MARKKKEVKEKEAAPAVSAPIEDAVGVFTTPLPDEVPLEDTVKELIKEASDAVEASDTRMRTREEIEASEVQLWMCGANMPGPDMHYDKYGTYPEDEFILKQNEEDAANGYPNRFFRKL